MNEVLEAASSRIKSPYFGYSVLAFFALNWRGIFLLLTTEGMPSIRLAAFDCATSFYSLLLLPLLFGTFVAASTHWIRYFFSLVSRKPLELIDNLVLEAEHKKTIRQAQLEQSRSDLLAVTEKELIARAKRDEEVAAIRDTETKEKLIEQLEAIRQERDKLSAELKNQTFPKSPPAWSISKEAKELLVAAATDKKNGAIIKTKFLDGARINAGGINFGSEGSRDFARYEKAIEELISMDFLKDVSFKGEVFQLTHEGWSMADSL